MSGENPKDSSYKIAYQNASAPGMDNSYVRIDDTESVNYHKSSIVSEAGDFNSDFCRNLIASNISRWSLGTFIYWTVCAGLAVIYNYKVNGLLLYTLIVWIIAFLLQLSVCAMGSQGFDERKPTFNSGYVRNLPKTFIVVFPFALVTIIDIVVHTGVSLYNDDFLIYSQCFIACHIVSLCFITGLFYKFHRKDERIFRLINFIAEWFDILSQIAVILIYNRLSNYEYKDTTLKVYWSIMLIQLFGWCLPIFIGTANSKRYIAIHVCILDILTDLPWIIITIISSAYVMHFWIFIDLFIKVLIMGRGCVVNICIYFFIPKFLGNPNKD
mmetsp:Transcript_65740/g.80456  ORF Transcript_65740/g.80456 Transcript_65740/m.80456 type:complete len:327 (+) Transcript_65740:847-1827(+)